ncbi:uncharacterized protein LOC114725382 isoform X2 [Neltuma alba]|uniref:uncharacterized protein LOC114725382 isoform X2 n=1 Tax=Neltuma alba TaxID=207710 RepID=UPI0010A410AA|nr:uncharacterized protein LOC114725382 isoform X2 [Prosopis alba]
MSVPSLIPPCKFHFQNRRLQLRIAASTRLSHPPSSNVKLRDNSTLPSMSDILEASRAQKLDLQLRTVGPFFRITAKSLESQNEVGRAEGIIRVWLGGRILHLDSMKLQRETIGMEKSIFGIGLFIGALAIRYGYDCGCKKAELLAINDSDLYHSKVLQQNRIQGRA